MRRLGFCFFVLLLSLWAWGGSEVYGQSDGAWPQYPQVDEDDPHTIIRGPGGYLSTWKLALIALIFLIWAKLADWINRDALKFVSQHELSPNIWNPIVLITFLAGLFGAVINIPFFFLGFPVYVLCAFVPWIFYLIMRRGKVDPSKLEGADEEEAFGHDAYDVPITFKAAGETAEIAQSNLIRARQYETFPLTAQLLYDSAYRRTEQLVLDYTRDIVNRRQQIDGAWLSMEPVDRVTGDSMLASLKFLAGLNPDDRRNRQEGSFGTKIRRLEVINQVTTQGVKTGERVVVKFLTEQKQPMELTSLGMWKDMHQRLKSILDDSGLVVVSAPQGQGLSSTWQAVLHGTDRYTRDWVSIIDHSETESEMENIEAYLFDGQSGQSPKDLLPGILLKQPSGLVVPNPVNGDSLDMLSHEVLTNDRMVITRTQAESAAEAILRTMLISKKDRKQFVRAVKVAVCQRLVRRLCHVCRQPMPQNPKLIGQLGGNPSENRTIYNHFQPPPPEQLVDDKGKPIEIPPCETCGGIGYIGRIAVFEILFVNDAIRKAIIDQANLEAVQKAARENGHLNLAQQGYRLVLEGVTSIHEIQRVMNKKS